MNFGFNEEQELLRSTARKFFDNECASEIVRKLMDGPEGMTPDLWKKIAEQGWTGLIFPDEHGGMGLGFVDLVVLMEEMGRAVVPGPFFSTVLLGGLAIREAGTDAQKKAWLPKISIEYMQRPISSCINASFISFWPTIALNGNTLPALCERLVWRRLSTADFDLSCLGILDRWPAQVFTPFDCAQQSIFNIEV